MNGHGRGRRELRDGAIPVPPGGSRHPGVTGGQFPDYGPAGSVLAIPTLGTSAQLLMILAFLVLGWWRNRDWYRARVTIPFSLLISVIGLYWTVERVIGG